MCAIHGRVAKHNLSTDTPSSSSSSSTNCGYADFKRLITRQWFHVNLRLLENSNRKSYTFPVKRDHRRVASTTGSARNRVLHRRNERRNCLLLRAALSVSRVIISTKTRDGSHFGTNSTARRSAATKPAASESISQCSGGGGGKVLNK